jgi:hypothetical protein
LALPRGSADFRDEAKALPATRAGNLMNIPVEMKLSSKLHVYQEKNTFSHSLI